MVKKIVIALVVLLFVIGAFAFLGNKEEAPITGHAVSDGSVAGDGETGVTEQGSKAEVTECSDGLDNDDDGLFDLDDPDCSSAADDAEKGTSGSGKDKEEPKDEPVEKPVEEEPACYTDADCEDGDDCNIDICQFPGHKNAYCTDEQIKRLKDGDGCCPEGANAENDWDCDPVCGNGVCEVGENERLCFEDCEHTGESGGASGDDDEGGDEGPREGGDGPEWI